MSDVGNPGDILKATQGDEDAIFAVLCRLHEENGLWPMNEKKVRGEIEKATRGDKIQPSIIGLIRGADKGIEGIVWLMLDTPWYGDWYYWSERLVYVVPEHRRSTHVKRLLTFAKWCADQMSAGIADAGEPQKEVPLMIGIQTFKALEPKMRLYQRTFKQVGAQFQYRLVPTTSFNQKRVEN